MNYGEIKWNSVENGTGTRVSIFVSGCRNHCPGCFNEPTWDFNYGKEFSFEVQNSIIEHCKEPYIHGVSILGGEPLEPENQEPLMAFLITFTLECPGKTVWLYTGFTWEELKSPECRARTEWLPSLLSYVDVMVDGRFVQAERDITLRFRGSRNQRIIDVQKTILSPTREVVLWKE